MVGTNDTDFKDGTGDILWDTTGLDTALADNGAKPGYPQTLKLLNTSKAFETGDLQQAGKLDERGLTRQNKVSMGAYDPDAM
jgi:hypothetical protein